MRRMLMLLLAVPALCMSASAAASGLEEGEANVAPAMHLTFSFGAADQPLRLHSNVLDAGTALGAVGPGEAKMGVSSVSSTTRWIVLGAIAVAVVAVVANSSGGDYNSPPTYGTGSTGN